MYNKYMLLVVSLLLLILTVWGARNGVVNESVGIFLFGFGITSLLFKLILLGFGKLSKKQDVQLCVNHYFYVASLYPILLLACYFFDYLLFDFSTNPFSFRIIFSLYINTNCILGSVVGLCVLYFDSLLLDKVKKKG